MSKNAVCKKCNNLVNGWCEKVIDSPDPDMARECRHFCEKTNADRIRAMNDEELIKLLTGFCAFACIFPDKDCEHGNCEECVKEWLSSPAE